MDRIHAGSHGAEAIPVPIPNTEVKLRSADDTGCVPGKQVAAGFFFVLFPVPRELHDSFLSLSHECFAGNIIII